MLWLKNLSNSNKLRTKLREIEYLNMLGCWGAEPNRNHIQKNENLFLFGWKIESLHFCYAKCVANFDVKLECITAKLILKISRNIWLSYKTIRSSSQDGVFPLKSCIKGFKIMHEMFEQRLEAKTEKYYLKYCS